MLILVIEPGMPPITGFTATFSQFDISNADACEYYPCLWFYHFSHCMWPSRCEFEVQLVIGSKAETWISFSY